LQEGQPFTYSSGSGGDEELGPVYGERVSDGSVSKHLRSTFYEPNAKTKKRHTTLRETYTERERNKHMIRTRNTHTKQDTH